MLANPTIQAARLRLARHYVQRIAEMAALFEHGGENNVLALAQFDAERGQVDQWLAWLIEQAQHSPTPDDAQTLLVQLLLKGSTLIGRRTTAPTMIGYYELALGICEQRQDMPSMNKLLPNFAIAQHTAGNIELSIAICERGLTLAETLGDLAVQADLIHSLLLLADDTLQLAQARALIEQGLRVSERLGDRKVHALILTAIAWYLMRHGEWQQAQAYLDEAYDPIMRYGSQDEMANLFAKLGRLTIQSGDIAAAKKHFAQALDFSLRLGDAVGSLSHLRNMAVIADLEGDFATAQSYYLRALTLARQTGSQRAEAGTLANLGYSAYLQGNFAESLHYTQEALALLRKFKLTMNLCVTLANVIPVCVALGRYEEALAALGEGLEIAVQLEAEALQVMMLVAAAQVWVAFATAEGASDAEPMLQTAALWSGFVLACPIAEQENRDEVMKLLPQIEAALGPERSTALAEQGKTLVLADAIEEVLRFIAANLPFEEA